ncbi:hypothetical protein [Methylomonas koyamae]|nr:hypothetical protein [Methylomonas koyamae]
MPSSLSNRFKISTTIQQSESVQSMFSGHHATVHCHECNRTMVPRVVIYYGQPLKSICPFCGATFTKFQSGFGRFINRFHSSKPSLAILGQLLVMAVSCLLLFVMSDLNIVSDQIGLVAFYGAVIFGVTFLAELLFQGIEQLASRLSHEINYYWLTLITIGMLLAITHSELAGYIGAFFMIILLRGLIVGLICFWRSSH